MLNALAISVVPSPLCLQLAHARRIYRSGAALADAGRLCLADPLKLPLAAKVRLKLGEDAEHVQEALAGRPVPAPA